MTAHLETIPNFRCAYTIRVDRVLLVCRLRPCDADASGGYVVATHIAYVEGWCHHPAVLHFYRHRSGGLIWQLFCQMRNVIEKQLRNISIIIDSPYIMSLAREMSVMESTQGPCRV